MKRLILLVTLMLSIGVGLLFTLRWLQRLPSGPVDIVWDKEACAHCHMHVGEPRFAAQLQTQEGDILNFDDPGCLLRYQAEQHRAVHAIYFHHHREDRWLTGRDTVFVPVEPTPMGYNLGAAASGVLGALSYEEATRKVVASGATP